MVVAVAVLRQKRQEKRNKKARYELTDAEGGDEGEKDGAHNYPGELWKSCHLVDIRSLTMTDRAPRGCGARSYDLTAPSS